MSRTELYKESLPPTTAAIYPEKFSDDLSFARGRNLRILLLFFFLLLAFGLRTYDLGKESFGEDELNKLMTVNDYRSNGLSGRNGEHPFLMKGLQTVSVSVAARLNGDAPESVVSDEFALRFPTALFGTFTTLLIFLLVSQMFGSTIGITAAALWAVDPSAIGFDRVAKEDSFYLFFFVLGGVFWLRAQAAAERSLPNWIGWFWAAGAAFGAMLASKYLPHMLAVSAAYYRSFIALPQTKWHIGKMKWLTFFAAMGVAFLLLNPTILFPETWQEMRNFGGEKRIGHDSYEYLGSLYRNQMSAWFQGVPWTFYFVFIAVKTPLTTLALFLAGVPLMFRRELGDGRIFILFWTAFWFLPFSVIGGKFTRYFAVAEPLILISAAVGFYFIVRWLSRRAKGGAVLETGLFVAFIGASLGWSISVAPHYRLFTNVVGGGGAAAGSHFPHDEFYDASTRDIIRSIARTAPEGAAVANETPYLFEYYAAKEGRPDLISVSLSEKDKVRSLKPGDFVVAAKGRRYFSNTAYLEYLNGSGIRAEEIRLGDVVSAQIYRLDERAAAELNRLAR